MFDFHSRSDVWSTLRGRNPWRIFTYGGVGHEEERTILVSFKCRTHCFVQTLVTPSFFTQRYTHYNISLTLTFVMKMYSTVKETVNLFRKIRNVRKTDTVRQKKVIFIEQVAGQNFEITVNATSQLLQYQPTWCRLVFWDFINSGGLQERILSPSVQYCFGLISY